MNLEQVKKQIQKSIKGLTNLPEVGRDNAYVMNYAADVILGDIIKNWDKKERAPILQRQKPLSLNPVGRPKTK